LLNMTLITYMGNLYYSGCRWRLEQSFLELDLVKKKAVCVFC
jgi:hypothetical protein